MNRKETGVGLILCGLFFVFFGLILFMDKGIMTAGNFIVILGLIILETTNLCTLVKLENIWGLGIFIFSLVILFKGYFILGLILEITGLSFLFYSRIPSIKNIAKTLIFKIIRN
ncbi:hypothetical protein EDEG_00769 [Edhazardia aedis USNM 41457]|uniref:Got1-like family protein n=1 Tax=Edhazardia aedis (strain USNM 41457) TaxID=1003232 RepID=J8ZZU4_EDHAE|nr:hypothetical protein EDEG_00769 [Edhazardia aedis USNM 41457]|eukprot:EJW05158.1 hypothetical protein EDEG_00769 [Edhazardia aedis USNM 41457]